MAICFDGKIHLATVADDLFVCLRVFAVSMGLQFGFVKFSLIRCTLCVVVCRVTCTLCLHFDQIASASISFFSPQSVAMRVREKERTRERQAFLSQSLPSPRTLCLCLSSLCSYVKQMRDRVNRQVRAKVNSFNELSH